MVISVGGSYLSAAFCECVSGQAAPQGDGQSRLIIDPLDTRPTARKKPVGSQAAPHSLHNNNERETENEVNHFVIFGPNE